MSEQKLLKELQAIKLAARALLSAMDDMSYAMAPVLESYESTHQAPYIGPRCCAEYEALKALVV